MQKQFEPFCKDKHFLPWVEKSFEHGYGIWRNLCKPNPTALEVVEQYQHARDKGYLTKDDSANYNNRWLCFDQRCLIGQVEKTFEFMIRSFGLRAAHIYANWIRDGHNYGRHKDTQDVILVQMWNETAYTVESEKQHTSFTLSPGDALYIRNGVWHTPVILEERATMSFSWE